MKTIIEIPDDLYRKAEIRAEEQGMTLRTLVIQSLMDKLLIPKNQIVQAEEMLSSRHSEIDEWGWPVLKRKPGDTTIITDEFINKLREEEGI